ncbi:CopG family ribbon-helix-helix protein [Halopiger xanaduensis]|uniref:Transcriptional regulator NikR, CopG family n=1 Tax=Halopiger xanaduensis (strain DSM 18323 / JCM 14033 / SH-6) TaxID=797210 RepID=F8D793_HALXS|nr:transcriptional regulator NikR [Halopiger xanaduensis]AEH36660.1 transcriptional regulator NikR, CopG family [Halopiger xanaduensis SH-6]
MRTSLNVPDDLLSRFDDIWQEQGLESRSRGVREAMREYVEAHTRLEDVDGDIVAIVAFDYDHESVIEDLHDIQHEFQDVVTTTTHTHEGEWCLETVFCRGAAERIRTFAYRLRDFDAVRRVKLLLLADR